MVDVRVVKPSTTVVVVTDIARTDPHGVWRGIATVSKLVHVASPM
jgi:hypothetical protein